MSKIYKFTVTVFILVLLAYVLSPLLNRVDSEPKTINVDTLPTLLFLDDIASITDSIYKAKEDSVIAKRYEDYKQKLKKIFDYKLTVDTLYTNLKSELEYCSENDLLKELFSGFSNGLNQKTRSEKDYQDLQKQWIKDAIEEENEKVQEFYSNYSGVFRKSNRYYYLNVWNTELRPGEHFRVTGNNRYRRNNKLTVKSMDVTISKLKLDSLLMPSGYSVVHKGKTNLNNGRLDFEYKLDTSGIYKVTLANSLCFKQFWVHVSWLDGIVKTDKDKMLIYISSYKDTIAPPFRVNVINEEGELYSTYTNDEGLLVLKHKYLSKKRSRNTMIAVEKNNQMAFLTGFIPKYYPDTIHVNYTYTDCPVYRPGKVVHFGGIVKMLESGTPVERRHIDSVEVIINGPQRTELYKKTLAIDKWGHYGDTISLEKTQKQGLYYFRVNAKNNKLGKTHHLANSNNQHYQFRVDAYKKPEFKINVSSDRKTYTDGDTINLNIKGEYFFGGPLSSSEIKVRWYRQQMHYYGGFYRRIKGGRFYPSGEKAFIKEEIYTLNELGKTEIQHKVNLSSNHEFLIAEVIVVDKSRREIREELKVRLSKYDTFLDLKLDKWQYSKGDVVKCQVSAVSLDGEPVTGSVKMRVRKQNRILVDTVITLNNNGLQTFNYKTKATGHLTFITEMKEKNDKIIKTTQTARVYKSRVQNHRWDFTNLTFNKKSYYTGDTALVTVQTGADSIDVLCTVEGNRLFDYNVKKLIDNTIEYRIPIKKNMGCLIQFMIAYSGETNMIMRSETAHVRDRSLFLDVKVDGKKRLEPGDTFRGMITVKDNEGIPVKANFSIALVDEAIFEFAKKLNSINKSGYEHRYNFGMEDTASGIYKIFPRYLRNSVFSGTNSFKREYMRILYGGYLQTPDDLIKNNWMIKNGVLAIISGNVNEQSIASVDIFGSGGFASGIDAVLSGVNGLRSGGGVKKKSTAGIGYGAGVGSGFGGGSGGVDDLIGSLMGGDGGTLNLKKRGGLKISRTPPRERSDFKDLAYWDASCSTNSRGRAKIEFKMPDDLTQWRLVLIGSDGKIHFIEHYDTLITKQNVMVKLEAPRSVVEEDSLLITSVVHNYSDTALMANVSFKIRKGSATLFCNSVKSVLIERGGTERIDWPVKVTGTDSLEFYTSIISDSGSDAESRKFPVLYKGIVKHKSISGVVGHNSNKMSVAFIVPENIKKNSHKVTLYCSPTLVGSMFESLEYLTGYPYGCVEQTMSRFLPNLYVQKVMKRMNIENDTLLENMPKYTHKGIERLEQLQNKDGSWGWWRSDRGDGRLTALVIFGLRYALDSYIDEDDKVKLKKLLNTGEAAAIRMIESSKINSGDRASLINSLSKNREYESIIKREVSQLCQKKDSLNTASLARLMEVADLYNMQSEKSGFLRLILSRVQKSGDAVYWDGSTRYHWHRQAEETTAEVLKVLVSAAPNNALIPKTVRWLSRRKKNGYWVSTKTTARVIEALSCYLLKSNELEPNYTAEVKLNGKVIHKTGTINKKSLGSSDFELSISSEKITDTNSFEISINGEGVLYYSLTQQFVSAEDSISKNENGISITRSYQELKYIKDENGSWKIVRKPFDGILKSGEELEVTINVNAGNSGEFMMLEDFFPSGMEYLRKPERWYSRWCGFWFRGYTHKEARDDRMVFFMTHSSGKQTFSYLLRAETPGKYTILPAKAELMYEPEICGNSEGSKMIIVDGK